jgi:heme/copper-type cytochrome/quinol oxidase subunit 3
MTSVTLRPHGPDGAAGHAEDPAVVGRRWQTGVLLLILADVSFVAALLFSYLYLRGLNTSHAWLLPKQQIAAIWVGWLIAGILVLSAIVYRVGLGGIRAGSTGRLAAATGVGVVLLLADFAAQLGQLVTFPFGIVDSAYSSEMYALGGANIFHLLITLFLGIGVWNRTRRGLYSRDDARQVQMVGLWWTWIAVAAVATALVTSFVTSPKA